MFAKERGEGTGKFVEKKLTLDKNLFSAKYFQTMLYHQTTANQREINELKITLCFKCELMRPSKAIINLANLRTMFGYLFEEIEFTANAKSSMQVSPCTNHAPYITKGLRNAIMERSYLEKLYLKKRQLNL